MHDCHVSVRSKEEGMPDGLHRSIFQHLHGEVQNILSQIVEPQLPSPSFFSAGDRNPFLVVECRHINIPANSFSRESRHPYIGCPHVFFAHVFHEDVFQRGRQILALFPPGQQFRIRGIGHPVHLGHGPVGVLVFPSLNLKRREGLTLMAQIQNAQP